MSTSLFIADLHLSADRPQTRDLFLSFLEGPAKKADALYILGDLFDAWIGDDDSSELANKVRTGLNSTAQRIPIFFQHGNRDFLIGADFCNQTGCQLLEEETVIQLNGVPTLLMHGDLLCTDDVEYQQARRLLRNPDFIADFLGHSIDERYALAAEYRRKSGEVISLKAEDIMDVSQETVIHLMEKYQTTQLIHGHTHRPMTHQLLVHQQDASRYVLGEWHRDAGMYLHADDEGITAMPYPA